MQMISRAVFFRHVYRKIPVFFRSACATLAAMMASVQIASATIVRVETTLGIIDIELYDEEAPLTVANFFRYAGQGNYDNSLIHRSVSGFIIQGGGHSYFPNPFSNPPGQPSFFKIPPDAPIQNEFSPSRSNIRHTVAMAKLPNNPDSATNEFFFNLSDNNAANLDHQNGGFTVFGRVLDTGPGTGMYVVDAIAALPIFDGANNYPFYYPCNPNPITGQCTNPTYFQELPTVNYDAVSYDSADSATYLQAINLVAIIRIPNVRSTLTNSGALATFTADVDMVFDKLQTVDTNTARSLLTTFSSPSNQSAHFNNGMFTLSMTGAMGPTGRAVTMYDGASVRPTHYYAYGPTPDNPTSHWYDFAFDGETGAEIKNDRIILHFVDGKRGDEDLDSTNDSITHTGAQAVVTTTSTNQSAQSGGCSIATAPSPTIRGGDWMLVSLFLVYVALVRKRTRRQRF